jgi:hypothetical protein
VVGQLPAEQASHVRGAVNHAFLDGLQVSALVCAGIALAAAVAVARLLPSRIGEIAGPSRPPSVEPVSR